MFPRDTVLRFSSQRHRIEVIEDVFSQTSNQRKLALLSGRGRRAQFATAEVLDFQARRGARTVAVFWLDEFLDAVPDRSDEQASTFVGKILLEASRTITSPEDHDQIQAAVVALRHSPPAARSIASIGEDFLDGGALEAYQRAAVEAVRDEATRNAHFRLDREKFAAHVGYRFFRLQQGTAVIAPIDVVNQGTVQVEVAQGSAGTAPTRVLHVDDVIVTEQLRRSGA